MTIYDEIEIRQKALEDIAQRTKNIEDKLYVNGIISKLTLILESLVDKTRNGSENLQGGSHNINTHLELSNDIKYSNVYDNFYLQSQIDKAEKIIRKAGSTQDYIND